MLFSYFTCFLVFCLSLTLIHYPLQLLENHQKPLTTDVYTLQKSLWNFSFSLLSSISLRARFFYSQFWNENGWYRMPSQHSVHSAPGSRMDGMAFCLFQNMNAEWKKARISHSGHSHSRIVNKKTRCKYNLIPNKNKAIKALLHCAILSATCLVMPLRDKLLENRTV